MKIQCDVCDKMEASVFCAADEAALCQSCDRTIHHANKLASKHARFSLHYPSSKHFPLCDICQEKRAYLFCQEDRAILCRECDLPIHSSNEHTQNHNRFLLTGVKLSASSLDPAASSSTTTTTCSEPRTTNSVRSKINRPRSVSVSNENQSSNSNCKVEDNMTSDTGSVSTSSFSEYLIESIPGYCFEDLLDASFAPNGFCKNYDHPLGLQDQDNLEASTCLFPWLAWMPQVQVQVQSPQVQVQSPSLSTTSSISQIGSVIGVKGIPKANTVKGTHYGCTVPETSFIKKSRRSR